MKIYEIKTSARNAEEWAINRYDENAVKGAFFRPAMGVMWSKEHDDFLKSVGNEWINIPKHLQDYTTFQNFCLEIRLIEEKV